MNDLLLIIIQAVLAVVSIVSVAMNRREGKARIENLSALTKKADAETDRNYQDQINTVIDKNLELFNELETERENNRKAQIRISKDIVNLQTDLRMTNSSLGAEQVRNVKLDDELTRYKKSHSDNIVKIEELKQQLANQGNKIEKHDVSLEIIKRKTGQLLEQLPKTMEHENVGKN